MSVEKSGVGGAKRAEGQEAIEPQTAATSPAEDDAPGAPSRDFSQGKAPGGSTAFRGGFKGDDLHKKFEEQQAAKGISPKKADRLEKKAERLEKKAEKKEARAEELREKAGRPKAEKKETAAASQPASRPATRPSTGPLEFGDPLLNKSADQMFDFVSKDPVKQAEALKTLREVARRDPEQAKQLLELAELPNPAATGPEVDKQIRQVKQELKIGTDDDRAHIAIDDLVSSDTSKRGGGADAFARLARENPKAAAEAFKARRAELEKALPADGFQKILQIATDAEKAAKEAEKAAKAGKKK